MMSNAPTRGAMLAATKIQARLALTLRMMGIVTSDPAKTIPGPQELAARLGMAQDIDRDTVAAEMLTALKELLRVDDAWHGSVNSEMSSARAAARTAIAKAEGRA